MVESERVLVTGGSGYIASFCIAQLLREGTHVRTTVRSLTREAEVRAAIGKVVDAGSRLKVVVADLNADAGWGRPAPTARACCTSRHPYRRAIRRTTRTWCGQHATAPSGFSGGPARPA